MFRKSKSVVVCQLSVVSIAIMLCVSSAQAKEAKDTGQKPFKQKAPIIVNGDKVEYFHEQKKVIGNGHISIDYQDVRLTCDRVTVYLDTREAIAEGNVKVTQKDTYLTGDRMNYNFDTKIGRIIDGYVNYVPFYGKSKQVDKMSENQIDIEKGYITTCDLDHPHYRVEAKQVQIYLEDKVIARNIVFYVGNCPILYMPYYVQPIKEESSHMTAMAGHDSDWGYYLLTSMKFDYSDIFKGRYRLDYRTKNGLAEGVDDNYSLPGLGDGTFSFYGTAENDRLAYKPLTREEYKYRIQVRHKWQVTDDTLMTLELNKVRDENFIKYYFYNEFEEQTNQVDNYVSFVQSRPDYNTLFLARVRLDKYFDVVQRLPEYNINIPKYNIKNTPLYYDGNLNAVYLDHAFRNNSSIGPMQKDIDAMRLDAYNKISYPFRVLRSLNIAPFAGVRQTYYSRNRWGDTNVVRGIFDTGFDSSIKFYKVYDVNTNFLDLDIHKLRHIITPTASYSYIPHPTVDPFNLNQFDALDSFNMQNHVLLALENKLQTKRNDISVDLVDFIISTDYLIRSKEQTVNGVDEYKINRFKYVNMQLELTPYPWLYMLSKMRINTNKELPESASIDFVGGKDIERSLAFGYRYANSFDAGSIVDTDTNKTVLNYLTTDAIYRINELWKVRAYWRFNMNRGYIDEQQYTIYRDLHCWEIEFTYDLRPYQDNGTISDQIFWFALRLKAFPNQPLGLRRTYSRTRAGEPGTPGFTEHQTVGVAR